MKNKSLCILLLAFSIIGCDNYHYRDCTSLYYDYNNWQPIDENDTIKFVSTNSEEISFVLEEANLSEPYTVRYEGGTYCEDESEDVVCNMRGVFDYHSEELGVDLRIEFSQSEVFEQPIDEQTVFYEAYFKDAIDTVYTPLHGFKIEPDFSLLNSNQTTFDSIVLNNRTYYDIIQSEIDTTSVQLNDKFSFWKLIASRGKGIIYLADKSGKEYFLEE